jgi:hypothetical protein
MQVGKARTIMSDDLKRAGVAGDIPPLDIEAIKLLITNMPVLVAEFGDCLFNRSPLNTGQSMKLEDADYYTIAELLRGRVVLITQAPMILGRESSRAKILKIETREGSREDDVIIVNTYGSGWIILQERRVVF